MDDTTKHATISAAILYRVEQGMTLRQAFDDVLGAGTVSRITGEVYDTLRARATVKANSSRCGR